MARFRGLFVANLSRAIASIASDITRMIKNALRAFAELSVAFADNLPDDAADCLSRRQSDAGRLRANARGVSVLSAAFPKISCIGFNSLIPSDESSRPLIR